MDVTLVRFLDDLFTEGRVRVARPAEISAQELSEADRVLAACERQYRLELPNGPPAFLPEAARWAATMFYRACQFAIYRDLGEADIPAHLSTPCPGDESPAAHYSVDLTFRYLPDLLKLARGVSEGDPLVARLQEWAAEWPLSSVGIAGTNPQRVACVLGHPGLLRLYVDRIITRGDASRLAAEPVCECIRAALGAFPELAPKMAEAVGVAAEKQPQDEEKRDA